MLTGHLGCVTREGKGTAGESAALTVLSTCHCSSALCVSGTCIHFTPGFGFLWTSSTMFTFTTAFGFLWTSSTMFTFTTGFGFCGHQAPCLLLPLGLGFCGHQAPCLLLPLGLVSVDIKHHVYFYHWIWFLWTSSTMFTFTTGFGFLWTSSTMFTFTTGFGFLWTSSTMFTFTTGFGFCGHQAPCLLLPLGLVFVDIKHHVYFYH